MVLGFSLAKDPEGVLHLQPSMPMSSQFLDLRVAVLGNVDSGKSTLLGVLTQGELDNGRGRARLNLFRHLHEIQSGRTSSISFEILGFNSKGEVHGISGTQWGQTHEDGLVEVKDRGWGQGVETFWRSLRALSAAFSLLKSK